ncbi:MAG: hypothetical protein KUL78_03255 [Flavobacterium sp.]|nr:hypothetical protein [Flavobacterium sp.]
MRIQVDEDGQILLTEVYSGVGLKTRDGEFMGICMRDAGFEFNYNGTWYEAKGGVIRKMGSDTSEDDAELKDKYWNQGFSSGQIDGRKEGFKDGYASCKSDYATQITYNK